MAQTYEVVLIVRADGTEEHVKEQLQRAETVITKDGGMIQHTDAWGRRRLAYPIKKQREGVYHLLQVSADPGAIEQWRRSYCLDENILRVLILRTEGHGNGKPVEVAS